MQVRSTSEFKRRLDALRDLRGLARIQARIQRLLDGNPGSHRNLKHGCSVLKVDIGPGYRVYYTVRRNVLIALLCGGDKSTQSKDIRRAYELALGLGDDDGN